MKKPISLFFAVIVSVLFSFCYTSSYASHIVGADLSYSWVSGMTYKVTIVLYGDCGPASSAAFSTLPTSEPLVCVYDGDSYSYSASLAIQAPTSGVEVTPVDSGIVTQCASISSVYPGIKKFVYSSTITLPHTSSNWRFIYNGSNGTGSDAARAAAITNLSAPASTIMQLIDTLNNTAYNNSSVIMSTTMPYYYPINQSDNYNSAAVDPDGDSIYVSFVSATNGDASGMCATIGGDITYMGTAWPGTPVSATTPLQVATDSLNMNSHTGQISFYPNVSQRSVIFYNIREFRGGVLVGTCQREMTVLVLPHTTESSTIGASGISVFPNPANDEVTIYADNAIYTAATFTNVLGRQVTSAALTTGQTKVNVSCLAPGMYYITLQGEGGVKVVKFEKI